MKQTLFTIILLGVSILSLAQEPPPKYSITINEFKNQEIKEFNTTDDPTITEDKINKGFYIAITDIKINEFKLLNEDGVYVVIPRDNPSLITGQTTFTFLENQGVHIKSDKIFIKIYQETNSALLTLKVAPSNDGSKDGKTTNSDCNPFVTNNSDCNSNDKYFGESVEYFTDNTIVYVYDYNKDPSKRVFYKITESRNYPNSDSLQIELESKKAILSKSKKEFDKDKTNETNKNAFQNAQKDVDAIRNTLENSKKPLHKEIVNLNKETLTTRKNVKFKIYNINKFMYNVSIADSLVQFESEPPALFNEFFLGDKDGLLGSLIKTVSDGVTAKNFTENSAKKLIENISCFIKNYNTLRGIAIDAYNPSKSFHCCDSIDYADFLTVLSQIMSQTKVVESNLIAAKASLQKMSSEKDSCFNQLRLKTSKYINIKNADFSISRFDLIIEKLTLQDASLKNQIDKIQKEIESIESQMYFSSGADSLTKKTQLSRLEKELTEKKVEFTSNSSKLIEQQTKRLDLEIERNEVMNSLDSVKIEISLSCDTSTQAKMVEIEEMINSLEISNYLLANLPSEEMLRKLIIFVNNMVSQNYIHTKDYISLNGNMLDLTLSISSKDSSVVKKFTGINVVEHISIQIPIIGKPFASFSSGSFVAIGSRMQNKTYAWQETIGNNNTTKTDSYTLVESGYTIPPMGFSALGNLQWKASRSFGLGVSVGVGLTIEESPRLAYLGGVSLFFGDIRQFAITSGFSGMQVNKLTNNFKSIVDNQVIYTSKPDIQSYQEFRIGTFISLTYTPFEVYKTKTVKSKNK